jgi:putative transposase
MKEGCHGQRPKGVGHVETTRQSGCHGQRPKGVGHVKRTRHVRTADSLRSLAVAPALPRETVITVSAETTHRRRKLHRIEAIGDVRFLTFSCFHRLPLFDNDAIKDAFVEVLDSARARTCFRLIAWVVMPEHVHLMIVPDLPDHPIAEVLRHLKGGFANRVFRRWRVLDAPILARVTDPQGKQRFWQKGGGYDRNIRSTEEFEEKLSYIHANPVQRGLVACETDWRWSSAAWYAGDRGPHVLRIDPIDA